MKNIIAVIALVLACITPVFSQTVSVNGSQFTQSTNSNGQIVLTPSVGSALPTGSSSPAPTLQSFGTSFVNYFSSFNANLTNTFSTNQPYQVWLGASYQSGVFLGGLIGFEAQPFSGCRGLTLREVSTLAPTVGTLAGEEFDIGYSISYVDTRLTAFTGAHYDIVGDSMQAAFGIEVEKALTQNTFAGLFAEGITHDTKNGQLIIGFVTGATF